MKIAKAILLAIALANTQSLLASTTEEEIATLGSVLSSADRQSLSESLALTKAISHVMQQSNDQRLQKDIDVQRAYQASMIDLGKTILSNSKFIDLTATIGASEIATHATHNQRYIQFQAYEGNDFDSHGGVQALERLIRDDMEKGWTERIVGNPVALAAVIRHRAALLMIRNPESPLEDKFFALKYLIDEGAAFTQQ